MMAATVKAMFMAFHGDGCDCTRTQTHDLLNAALLRLVCSIALVGLISITNMFIYVKQGQICEFLYKN